MRQPWARWSGRAGYAARGVVFIISGYLLLRAGFHEQASEAGGMDEALRLYLARDVGIGARKARLGFLVEVDDLPAAVVKMPYVAKVEECFDRLGPDAALLHARAGVGSEEVHGPLHGSPPTRGRRWG